MVMILTPFIIMYLIILDIVYYVNTLIILPMILIINKIFKTKIDQDQINNIL